MCGIFGIINSKSSEEIIKENFKNGEKRVQNFLHSINMIIYI